MVRIRTDNDITGWGEIHTPVAGEISQAVVDTLLAPILFGRDPRDIQPLWETMYATMKLRGHTSGYLLEAISGVDIALWDIVGKAVNAPIAKLLGGMMRDRVPVYASSLARVPRSAGEAGVQTIVTRAQELIEAGYRAFKVKLGIDIEQDRHMLEALRQGVGTDIRISVDVNGAYDFSLARRAGRMMEEYDVWWLEEPLSPENLRDYSRLTALLDIPVAGGECLCNRWIFNDYLAAGGLDVIQPDVGRAGGISECQRISMLADTYGIPFAPHVSTGTAVYMAASLQWATAGANLITCECRLTRQRPGMAL